MINNGVHKLKSQKWNEVSITDHVTLQAEPPWGFDFAPISSSLLLEIQSSLSPPLPPTLGT